MHWASCADCNIYIEHRMWFDMKYITYFKAKCGTERPFMNGKLIQKTYYA